MITHIRSQPQQGLCLLRRGLARSLPVTLPKSLPPTSSFDFFSTPPPTLSSIKLQFIGVFLMSFLFSLDLFKFPY
ncbi:hypothetical protein AOQ84DRAFT_170974 [Glonium stellatum]|uniref:Uncharacterized protein n=1 Tax=Glonium stellatum TaxID=574774 RepID=A0A8E2JWE0_9PEZI|nr:hypothetical protein AOQ84DRAFT_170974 [Glonium stellatum]